MTSLKTKVRIRKDVLFRDLGGEAVILNLETGKYYGLDEVATRMWVLLAQHGQVEPVYRALLEEYDVSEGQLHEDLLKFINELSSLELIQVEDEQVA